MTDTLAPHPQDVSALWLATQQAIASRTAHEIKNTLNGVAVNLEVVRSRLGRPAGAAPSPAATFAETASAQFELLTRQTEALLALMRPVPAPVDIAGVTGHLAALLGAAVEKDGGHLVVEQDGERHATAAHEPATVRLVVAAALLAAVDGLREGEARVLVAGGDDGPRVTVRRDRGEPLLLSPDVARVAVDAGVRIDPAADGAGLTLSFPATPRGDDLTLGS